jgi:hypothetical protein
LSPGERTHDVRRRSNGRHSRGSIPHAVRLSLEDLPIALVPGVACATPGRTGFLALSLPPGRWSPPVTAHADFTLSLVAGAMLRTSGLSTDVLLPGDMSEVDPAGAERWKVVSTTPALILLLSPTTVAEMAAVPGVTQALLRARSKQHERCIELRSIVGIYDIEDRILSFFAHLARHLGRPEGSATRIPLRLEQRRVEEILSAGHTQATTAFKSLFQSGALIHDAAGWLIACPPPNVPAREMRSAPNTISSNGH